MKMGAAHRNRRPYRQTARAQDAEATGRRIIDAFGEILQSRWFEDVTLDAVAEHAGVTKRTVIRRFGGKSGLLSAFISSAAPEIRERRTPPVGDVEGAVDRVLFLYEKIGDGAVRNLAQEPRVPELRPMLAIGRREHRTITAETFAPWLDKFDETGRRRLLDALVIATDLYTWKLLRRDMGRSRAEARAVMLNLVRALLKEPAA